MKFYLSFLLVLSIVFSCAENDGKFYDTSKLPDLTPITTANYSVTFQSNWNATNFPLDFPSNPAFGETILITHNNKGGLFIPSALSSLELTFFLTNNNLTPLQNNLNAQQAAMNLNWYNLGIFSTNSPNLPFLFSISSTKPVISLCMKINPSPNWFIGLSNFSLLENDGKWTDLTTVSLLAYDTDGFTQPTTTYNSIYTPNLGGFITKINPAVLIPNIPATVIGTLTFTKL
ncbi:MAG: hypothetical protein ACEQSF_04050 [Solirubrobacteraceae bacterium]